MHNPGFARVRRMQPRYRYKHPSQIRPATIPTPGHILVLVAFFLTATVWSQKIGFFASSDFSKPTSEHVPPGYEHGAVRVDHVTWYEGDDPHSSHTSQHHVPVDNPSRDSQQHPKIKSLPHRLEIHVDQLDTNQLPQQDQKPDHAPFGSPSDSDPDTHRAEDTQHIEENQHNEQTQNNDENQQTDDLQPPVAVQPKSLKEVLHFTPETAINFMHFHKTGGVSFKTSLHKFYHKKVKSSGQPVRVRDACYTREGVKDDPSRPTFLLWRCDWEPLREMTEDERNKYDFVLGHQFWGNGAGMLLNTRDLRSFTILRHPFDRKVSFYYHFFVREVGRKEEDVTFEDIRDFLLYDKLPIKADLGRDLGPNYMAGRLLSDGRSGFVGNSSYGHYAVAQDDKQKVAEEAKKLLRAYVFVGLQKESSAAKCMLRKVVETFNEVNGISNEGVERIDQDAAVLNRGSYSLSAEDIWKRFSEEEKVNFDRKERVDLLVYEEGERLFREHIMLFGCVDWVQDPKYKK